MTLTEERLGEVPALSTLYAQAIGRLAQAMISSYAPTALPEVQYVVEGVRADAEQLSGYQRLLGEPGTDTLPAGYVHVLAFPVAVAVMARPDFPLSLMGLVHVANVVEVREQLRFGDSLSVRAWAEGLRGHRSGICVDMVTEVRRLGAADAEPAAWRGVSTYLAKGKKLRGVAPAEPTERTEVSHPEVTARWRLDAAVGRRYAAVSGDRNPIHLSGLSAKLFGFPRAIAHGMYTAARALATVGAPEGPYRWDVEFGKPVLLPGTVAFGVSARADGGHDYAGWNEGRGSTYFSGSVGPL